MLLASIFSLFHNVFKSYLSSEGRDKKLGLFVNWLKKVYPFLDKLMFLHVCSTNLLKIMWEKEILLITSNVSFSNSAF